MHPPKYTIGSIQIHNTQKRAAVQYKEKYNYQSMRSLLDFYDTHACWIVVDDDLPRVQPKQRGKLLLTPETPDGRPRGRK